MHVADGDLYYIADETRKRGIENLEKEFDLEYLLIHPMGSQCGIAIIGRSNTMYLSKRKTYNELVVGRSHWCCQEENGRT